MGPLPSTGSPMGLMTRPRTPSPTPTDRIRPVCLTGSPSSICSASPSTMHPMEPSSRLKAMPRTFPGNSRSSFAMAPGSPSTMATPSPVDKTRPTCSRSIDGSKVSTYFRSAAAMSCDEMVRSCATWRPPRTFRSSDPPELVPGELQPTTDGPVEHLIAHPGHDPTGDRGIDQDLQVHVATHRPGQGLGQPGPALLVD